MGLQNIMPDVNKLSRSAHKHTPKPEQVDNSSSAFTTLGTWILNNMEYTYEIFLVLKLNIRCGTLLENNGVADLGQTSPSSF